MSEALRSFHQRSGVLLPWRQRGKRRALFRFPLWSFWQVVCPHSWGSVRVHRTRRQLPEINCLLMRGCDEIVWRPNQRQEFSLSLSLNLTEWPMRCEERHKGCWQMEKSVWKSHRITSTLNVYLYSIYRPSLDRAGQLHQTRVKGWYRRFCFIISPCC